MTAKMSKERANMNGYFLPWRYEGIAIVEQQRERETEGGGSEILEYVKAGKFTLD